MDKIQVPEIEQLTAQMTKRQLIKYADERGYTIDEKLSKEKIREAVLIIYEDRAKQSQEISNKTGKRMATPDDPLVRMKFLNLLSPGVDLEFNYDSGRGLKKGQKSPYYHFFHGKSYEVPYSVLEHLNELIVPDNKVDVDEDTGQIRGRIEGTKNLFSCQIILTPEQIRNLSKERKIA